MTEIATGVDGNSPPPEFLSSPQNAPIPPKPLCAFRKFSAKPCYIHPFNLR